MVEKLASEGSRDPAAPPAGEFGGQSGAAFIVSTLFSSNCQYSVAGVATVVGYPQLCL